MPVKLHSAATGDLLLLSASAKQLLAVLGKNSAEPGILIPEDMPGALLKLRALKDHPQPLPDGEDGASPAFEDEPVSLHQRAVPLIKMIEEAMAAQKPIVWGA